MSHKTIWAFWNKYIPLEYFEVVVVCLFSFLILFLSQSHSASYKVDLSKMAATPDVKKGGRGQSSLYTCPWATHQTKWFNGQFIAYYCRTYSTIFRSETSVFGVPTGMREICWGDTEWGGRERAAGEREREREEILRWQKTDHLSPLLSLPFTWHEET